MKRLMILSLALFVVVGLTFAGEVDQYDKNLINVLDDENVGIRSSAAQLLGDRKVEAAVDPLINMVKTEKNPSARIVAAVALFKIGDRKAIPVLKKLAQRDNNRTVRRVASGLVNKFEEQEYAKM